MRKVTLVRGARQLLTLRGPSGPRRGADLGSLGIIQDGAVLIADGLIVEVGPSRRLENLALARGAEQIDASGCVVLPGLVDSHMRVVRDGAQELSPRALKTLALRAVEEAVRCGTTAIEAKSGDLKMLRLQAALEELPLTFVSTFLAPRPLNQLADSLWPMMRKHKLADFVEIDCEDETILAKARLLGWGLKVSAGIALAAKLGATSVNVAEASERDAMLLGQSNTIATLSPRAAFHGTGEHYPPARMLIDHGAAVALASGVNQTSMQTTLALACHTMNMTVAEAIAASTINGAHALRRAGSIGSIEAGKSADLVILGVPDYREWPQHFGMNLASLVMIRGAVLVEKSEVKWPGRALE
jgi:imidazolonepropionase